MGKASLPTVTSAGTWAEHPSERVCPGDASIRGRVGRGREGALTRDKWGKRTVSPSPSWHRAAASGLPGDGEPDRSASAGQGHLPHWHQVPREPITPTSLLSLSGAAADPGHPWGMCQTITFLIEYLINYSGDESIIHISFKRGGKSHCPLTEALSTSQSPRD